MATGGKNSAEEIKLLKNRVKELESIAADYKKRLDELRKAKSTTIVKKEREVLEVNAPNLGQRTNEGKVTDLQRQLVEEQRRRSSEVGELRKQHSAEVSRLKGDISNTKPSSCGHLEVIESLHQTVLALEGDHSALLIENDDLKREIDELTHKLTVKEAKWVENEEILKVKLRQQWGEKYSEWMAMTEAKIDELQAANTLLKSYVGKDKPDGT